MIRIAVVEDNPDNAILVTALLGDSYDLVCYATGPTALTGINEDPPDLVLLDISLPEMDGTEVLRRLRECETSRDLPVIALTAQAMDGDRKRFLDMGFNSYITKPILSEDALRDEIERVLALSDS